MSRIHDLKVWSFEFEEIESGRKTFEFRKDDRGYAVGDLLRLREWKPIGHEYGGGELTKLVTYILRGPQFGVPEGYCVMSYADEIPQP